MRFILLLYFLPLITCNFFSEQINYQKQKDQKENKTNTTLILLYLTRCVYSTNEYTSNNINQIIPDINQNDKICGNIHNGRYALKTPKTGTYYLITDVKGSTSSSPYIDICYFDGITNKIIRHGAGHYEDQISLTKGQVINYLYTSYFTGTVCSGTGCPTGAGFTSVIRYE